MVTSLSRPARGDIERTNIDGGSTLKRVSDPTPFQVIKTPSIPTPFQMVERVSDQVEKGCQIGSKTPSDRTPEPMREPMKEPVRGSGPSRAPLPTTHLRSSFPTIMVQTLRPDLVLLLHASRPCPTPALEGRVGPNEAISFPMRKPRRSSKRSTDDASGMRVLPKQRACTSKRVASSLRRSSSRASTPISFQTSEVSRPSLPV